MELIEVSYQEPLKVTITTAKMKRLEIPKFNFKTLKRWPSTFVDIPSTEVIISKEVYDQFFGRLKNDKS